MAKNRSQGWNIPKFHEQLHVPDDILQNGSPAGTHSGPVEHNHIHFVKHLSKRKQKKRKTIDYQIASRTYENDIINNAAYSMDILTKDIETKNPIKYRSYIKFIKWFFMITNQNGKRIAIYTTDSMKLCKKALHYIVNEYPYIQEPLKAGENIYLSYFSEYKQNNQLICCHYNYRSKRP